MWDQLVNTFKPLSNPKFSLVWLILNVFEPLLWLRGAIKTTFNELQSPVNSKTNTVDNTTTNIARDQTQIQQEQSNPFIFKVATPYPDNNENKSTRDEFENWR